MPRYSTFCSLRRCIYPWHNLSLIHSFFIDILLRYLLCSMFLCIQLNYIFRCYAEKKVYIICFTMRTLPNRALHIYTTSRICVCCKNKKKDQKNAKEKYRILCETADEKLNFT